MKQTDEQLWRGKLLVKRKMEQYYIRMEKLYNIWLSREDLRIIMMELNALQEYDERHPDWFFGFRFNRILYNKLRRIYELSLDDY